MTVAGGHEVFHNVFDKAVALYYALDHRQAFRKGNKRTAFYSMYAFLWLNGKRFDPEPKGMLAASALIAVRHDYNRHDMRAFSKWIQSMCG